MEILFVGPMRIPIPSEKGAVEDIIWQLAKRVSKTSRTWIFNPVYPSYNKIRSLLAGGRILTWPHIEDLVIHSHTPYPSLIIALGRGRCKSHLVTLHFPPWVSSSRARNFVLINSLKALDRMGVVITSPSIFIRDWLTERGINSVYVPNGVDLGTFNPGRRDERLRARLLAGDDYLLVNLGRMHPTKNQLTLLKAFKEITKHRRAKLVLIGPRSGSFEGGKLSSYAAAVDSFIRKNGLADKVEWLGEVQTKLEVAKILASCDVYVHPSLVEAAPLALIEAMASGLPIVAFDLPYYRGYLEEGRNSVLCKHSAECISEAVLSLTAREIDSYSRERQFNYARQFSWDEIVKRYEKVYIGL